MDREAITICEAFAHAGYPLDAEAMLIIEVEGSDAECDAMLARIETIARDFRPTSVRVSRSEAESAAIWKGRKSAFGAIARIKPNYYLHDTVVPRRRLPEVLAKVYEIADRHDLLVLNVFHAGDGNLHPLILYDANREGELERTEAFGAEILKLSIEVGGTITGEHGVGVEKIDSMCVQFRTPELALFHAVKAAFDEHALLNPGKAVPTLHRCAEYGRMHVKSGQEKFADLPRF